MLALAFFLTSTLIAQEAKVTLSRSAQAAAEDSAAQR